jgi:hypothetical protein
MAIGDWTNTHVSTNSARPTFLGPPPAIRSKINIPAFFFFFFFFFFHELQLPLYTLARIVVGLNSSFIPLLPVKKTKKNKKKNRVHHNFRHKIFTTAGFSFWPTSYVIQFHFKESLPFDTYAYNIHNRASIKL